MNRIEMFFEKMEMAIRPGTKGAPARREKMRVLAAHKRRMNRNMEPKDHNRPGKEKRHGESKPFSEQMGRLLKMHKRVFSMVRDSAAPELLILWIKALNMRPDICTNYGHQLMRFLREWPKAKAEGRVTESGTIIAYGESVSWESYGKHSYPRIDDRYLVEINRYGSEVVYTLEKGERVKSAVDKYFNR